MAIEWNNVTWYSKMLAIVVYVITFGVAFMLGAQYQQFAYEKEHIKSILESRINPEAPITGWACPDETRTCPDGSVVVRSGPNCAFAVCPEANDMHPPEATLPSGPSESYPPVACTMDAKICPDGSAVGRVAPNCEFAPCPGY